MRLPFCLLFAALLPAAAWAAPVDAVYGPLWLYNGSWRITKKGQAAGDKSDDLVNRCAQYSKYFACEQAVNGQVSAILVYVPAKTAGHYYTQSIMPDGRAGGRGDLTINGDTWTYLSNWNQGGGRSTFFKTINVLSGKDHIHFEQQESTDNKTWKTTGSGDEVRTAPGRIAIIR